MIKDIKNFVKVGNHVADEARKISLKYFKKKLIIQFKDIKHFDPVTIAD